MLTMQFYFNAYLPHESLEYSFHVIIVQIVLFYVIIAVLIFTVIIILWFTDVYSKITNNLVLHLFLITERTCFDNWSKPIWANQYVFGKHDRKQRWRANATGIWILIFGETAERPVGVVDVRVKQYYV